MIGGALLQCLAANDRLHGDSGLEFRAVGAAFAQLLRRRLCLGRETLSQGRCPDSRLTIGPFPNSQITPHRLSEGECQSMLFTCKAPDRLALPPPGERESIPAFCCCSLSQLRSKLLVASCVYLLALFMCCPRIVNSAETGLFIL